MAIWQLPCGRRLSQTNINQTRFTHHRFSLKNHSLLHNHQLPRKMGMKRIHSSCHARRIPRRILGNPNGCNTLPRATGLRLHNDDHNTSPRPLRQQPFLRDSCDNEICIDTRQSCRLGDPSPHHRPRNSAWNLQKHQLSRPYRAV